MRRLPSKCKRKAATKSAEQCRAKIEKKLKLDYEKSRTSMVIRDRAERNRSSWSVLEALDSVLGHRPATRLSVMLDASANSPNQEEQDLDSDLADKLEECQEGPVLSQQTGSSSTSSPVDSTSSSQDLKSTSADVDLAEVPSIPPTLPIRSKKRKCTKDKKIEAVLTKVVKEVVDAQSLSDMKFLEFGKKTNEVQGRAEERGAGVSVPHDVNTVW